jgi:phenylpropionate dioxygenase-like ring-hydroxylating dioxygenase large terminal subunit
VERLPPRGGERHLPAVHLQYHGWRYSLDGDLTFVQQEPEFFDLDRSDFGLAPVRCEVWEGFVFVNLDNDDKTPLRDYLGGLAEGIAGYPFHRMTQVHKYRAEIGSNWKLFIDAFADFYHAPVLHAKQSVVDESRKLQGVGFEALAYDVDGPHSMVSSWGGTSPPKDLSMGHDARSGDPGGDDRGGRVRCDTRQSGMLAHHVGQPSAPDGLVRPVRRRRCRG